MDFNWDGGAPTGKSSATTLRTPADAMKILRGQCLEMCDGQMPEEKHKRVALVLSAVAALTVKTMIGIRSQHPSASPEDMTNGANHAMQLLLAAATFTVLDLYDTDFESLFGEMIKEPGGEVGYRFSRN